MLLPLLLSNDESDVLVEVNFLCSDSFVEVKIWDADVDLRFSPVYVGRQRNQDAIENLFE